MRLASGGARRWNATSPFSSLTSSWIVLIPGIRVYSASLPSREASAIVTWTPRISCGTGGPVCLGGTAFFAAIGATTLFPSSPRSGSAPAPTATAAAARSSVVAPTLRRSRRRRRDCARRWRKRSFGSRYGSTGLATVQRPRQFGGIRPWRSWVLRPHGPRRQPDPDRGRRDPHLGRGSREHRFQQGRRRRDPDDRGLRRLPAQHDDVAVVVGPRGPYLPPQVRRRPRRGCAGGRPVRQPSPCRARGRGRRRPAARRAASSLAAQRTSLPFGFTTSQRPPNSLTFWHFTSRGPSCA